MQTHFRTVLVLGLTLGGLCMGAGSSRADADRKVAADLVKLVTPAETYTAMTDQITKQMMASIRQQGGNLPADAEAKMKKVVAEVLPYDELASWSADVYATRFTTDELKELMGFYKTPLGKKVARLQPEISGEVGKKMAPILMARMPAALKKAGLTP